MVHKKCWVLNFKTFPKTVDDAKELILDFLKSSDIQFFYETENFDEKPISMIVSQLVETMLVGQFSH